MLVSAIGMCGSLLGAGPALAGPRPAGHRAVTSVAVTADSSEVAAPSIGTQSVQMSVRAKRRLAVGDSLMVGAAVRMRRRGFAVHAKVGRQFSTAPGIVRSYGSRLPRNLVIELGTNGTITLAHCRSVVRAAGSKRRVFLVTNRVPRSWEHANNRTLRACDRSFRGSRVRIVDWHGASAGHPEWFARDGIHLSGPGQAAFVKLIDRAVDRYGR